MRNFGWATAVSVVAMMAAAQPAWAQLRDFDVPAQPAVTAIPAFARQAGLQIVAPAAKLAGRRTAAVKGRMDVAAALDMLLTGTGLSVGAQDDRTISLKAADGTGPTADADPEIGGTSQEILVVAQAIRVSPSNMPLDVIQPTSVIDKDFIRNNMIPLASFDDIVKFAPSVWAQSPNGPGLGKNEGLSLRGFQDQSGQINMTYDGIPFGDSSDLHHTSSALFIAHDLRDAEIDRGPGTASQIGNATFGGTIGFRSKDPGNEFAINPYGTYGSFNTWAIGGELDSGEIKSHDSSLGKFYVDAQHEQSDGYLTEAHEKRTNAAGKYVVDLSPIATLTINANWNHAFEYTTQGNTLANIQKYGLNYGLGDNPAAQNYYRYQPSDYFSDFEYIGLKVTPAGGWTIDNRVYTTSFTHNSSKTTDPTDPNPANASVKYIDLASGNAKTGTVKGDIGGTTTFAHFRTVGDVLRVADDIGKIGTLRFGAWTEWTDDKRTSYSAVFYQAGKQVGGRYGVPLNTGVDPSTGLNTPLAYKFTDHILTVQPYLEFAWKPLDGLTVTPGVRYTHFDRSVNAYYQKGVKGPQKTDKSYSDWQPSIAANYQLTKDWTAYAQIAKGFLAPPYSVLQIKGEIPDIKPEQTINYQIGTAGHFGRLVASLDAYLIDFRNYINTINVDEGATLGIQSVPVNAGGAVYKGVELEAQYVVGHGWSLYGNATYNEARYKGTDVWIAEAPRWTAAAGLLYDQHKGPYASLIGKFVGPRWGAGGDISASTDASGGIIFQNLPGYHFNDYATVDLAAGWHLNKVLDLKKDITLSVKVSNLFNHRAPYDTAGTSKDTKEILYWTIPGRSVFANLSVSM
jgi:iron complex outermembrane recepter protein